MEFGLDDALLADPAVAKIEDLAYGMMDVDAPEWFRNPDFQVLFKDRPTYDAVAELAPVTLAPGLDELLFSKSAPSIDFFHTLPWPDSVQKLWGVYAFPMSNAQQQWKLYIGSGTDAENGVLKRCNDYVKGIHLPRHVELALRDGFTIQHIGLLCSTPLPSAGLVPKVRGRVLALEAAFAFIFHACFANSSYSIIQHLQLWPREAVEWAPLCSRLPLQEAIRGGLELSQEDLELANMLRHANRNAKSQRHRAKKRAEDETLYKQTVTRRKLEWSKKNSDRVLKTAERVRNKAKELHRFRCEDCDISLATASGLESHKMSQSHKDCLAGIDKAEPNKYVIARKAKSTLSRESGEFHCSACKKSFGKQWDLDRHLATKLHRKRLEEPTTGS